MRGGAGGPAGLLTKMVGTGVGVGQEYREHRKQKKALSRENSEQDANAQAAGPSSSQPQLAARTHSSTSDAPPAYDDVISGGSSRSHSYGEPSTGNEKASLPHGDYDAEADALYYGDEATPLEVDDERVWDLDEAGEPADDEDEADVKHGREPDLVREVLESQRLTIAAAKEVGFEATPLPVPVIIPQRRPRKKVRGFVQAYAPLLGECSGISQATFLLFLQNFHKASQASPIFPIIQMAAGIAGFAPSIIAQAVCMSVQIAAQIGQEVQERQRTNSFLARMNQEFFQPAGLFAMIVKYKSDAEVASSGNPLLASLGISGAKQDLSTNELIAKFQGPQQGESKTMSQRMQGLRVSSSTTQGSVAMPAAAPLIFPKIDEAVAIQGEETFKMKMKDAGGFLADYMDRRSQAKYASEDPNSALLLPESQRAFKSKLADPNNPMYNGGIMSGIGGGGLGGGRRGGSRGLGGGYGGRGMGGGYGDRSDRLSARREEMYDRRTQRYDRSPGRSSGRQYDAAQQRRGYGGYGDDDDYYEQDQRGFGGRGFGGRGRRGGLGGGGGLIGLAVKGIGAAVNASQNRNQRQPEQRSSEYEDSYGSRLGPGYQGGNRRSFDERDAAYGGPAPHAPYGGQNNPPAPYGGRSNPPAPYGGQSNPPAPYGGQSNPPAPYGGQEQDSYNQSTMQRGGGYGAGYGGGRGGRGGLGGGNSPVSFIKKAMKPDVLYLMIVNLPSEAELAEARATLATAQASSR